MQNCSDVNSELKPLDFAMSSTGTGDFCLRPPTAKKIYNNILFAIDQSGSNSWSDPTKSIRGTAIEKFFNDHKNDEYYRWGFIYYSGQAISSYINDGDDQVPTFADAAAMQKAIQDFYSNPDVAGSFGTDYTRSLQLVENALTNDINLNSQKSDEDHIYTIFYVSDGVPMESGQARPIAGADDTRVVKIKDLTNLPARLITLSTSYYYSDYELEVENGLKLMAEAGKGTYSNAVVDGKINFNEPVVGIKPESWRIKRMRMVVFNLNSAVCTGGGVGTDSDSDGICDEDEHKYNATSALRSKLGTRNFSPQNRNSLDASYGDAFVWKFDLLATGSGLTNCQALASDMDFDYLNSCEELMIFDKNANGPYEGWEIPNNSANPENPDSDGDAFLDWIEFSWFRLDSGYSAAVNYTNIHDYYADNVSAEKLMLEHRSLINPSVFNSSSYDSTLRFTGVNNSGENCYQFKQTQLALYPTLPVNVDQVSGLTDLVHGPNENKVLMYFIGTRDEAPNSKGVLFRSIRSLRYSPGQTSTDISVSPDLSEFDTFFIDKPE